MPGLLLRIGFDDGIWKHKLHDVYCVRVAYGLGYGFTFHSLPVGANILFARILIDVCASYIPTYYCVGALKEAT